MAIKHNQKIIVDRPLVISHGKRFNTFLIEGKLILSHQLTQTKKN